MRRIEWNHKVELTVTEGDSMKVIVADNLTPYQLDDLNYLMNDDVLDRIKDLRLRRTVLEVLATQPKHGYTDLIGLQRVICDNLKPFKDTSSHKDATTKAVEFNAAVDSQIDWLRARGAVDCNFDPEIGYAISGVKLTKVGHILCEVLFGD